MREQPNRSRTYISKTEQRIADKWPGGLDGLIADYIAGRCNLQEVSVATGAQYRAIRRVFVAHGVRLRSRSDAQRLDYQRNPGRIAKAAQALRTKSSFFRADVRKRAIQARKRAIAANPLIHLNASVGMTNREAEFAKILDAAGVRWEFNKPAPPYWLDFYLPDLRMGIEMQRENRASAQRHHAIIQSLGLANIIYIPTRYLREGLGDWISNLIAGLQAARIDPAALGQYCMVFRYPKKCHRGDFITLDGYKFIRP